jgi:hypothetical protein
MVTMWEAVSSRPVATVVGFAGFKGSLLSKETNKSWISL